MHQFRVERFTLYASLRISITLFFFYKDCRPLCPSKASASTIPTPSCPSPTMPSRLTFKKGIYAWYISNREPHQAEIIDLYTDDDGLKLAKVKWANGTFGDFPLCTFTPMFDSSKRERRATKMYAPEVAFNGRRRREKTEEKSQINKETVVLSISSLKLKRTPAKSKSTSTQRTKKKRIIKQRVRSRAKAVAWSSGMSKAVALSSSRVRSNVDAVDDEADYNSLWEYYLKPVLRKDEELPSGMVLRHKLVACNMLRFKDDKVRRVLHSKIKCLERSGKRGDIYRILKALRSHDMGVTDGDVPLELKNEVPEAVVYDEVEMLGTNNEGADERIFVTVRKKRSTQVVDTN
eukprot:scaffold14519_cov290-Alexandrium_tamarense.AAC.1